MQCVLWLLSRLQLHLPTALEPGTRARGPCSSQKAVAIHHGSGTGSLLLNVPRSGSPALKNPACQSCIAIALCCSGQLQLHLHADDIIARGINFDWKTCWLLKVILFPGLAGCWLASLNRFQAAVQIWKKFCKLTRNMGQSSFPSHLCFCLVLPVCRALCSFSCCIVDRNIWLFEIKAARGVSVGLFLHVSIAQVQLQEKRPIFSLTHAGIK